MDIKLGKLEEVPIRDIWEHEQYDFSAWLAKPENIKELGDTLSLSLTDIETEKFVGNYRCDIICKDEITKKNVLIENQLEPSDHDHLGKIITYASGLDAEVVIWIVETVKSEHSKAIEWLNEHTDDSISFFLIEIHAFKIGNSDPAPLFKVIEKPNDFARIIKETTKDVALNDSQTARLEFWNMFNEVVSSRNKPFNIRKATTDHWYSVAIGSSKCFINTDLVNKEHRIRLGLWIPDDKALFDKLYENKKDIETKSDFSYEWERLDDVKASRVCIYIEGLDFNNHSNYDELMNEVIDKILIMRKVFKEYI